MTLTAREHYELIAMFDKVFAGARLDKETKDLWARGYVYQDGKVNDLFLAFRHGAAYGQSVGA